MGTTALALINSAARKIGVKGRGRNLPADEAFEWLTGLKRMLDSWSVEHLMIPYRTRETFSLTNAQSYSMGPGGDFDTTRPMAIDEVQIIDAAGYQYDLTQVPIERWANLFTPGTTGRPRFFTYENGYPLATVRFDVIPYDPTVVMWTRKPIEAWRVEDLNLSGNPAFSGQKFPTSGLTDETLQADIEFDVGYENAIVFNLAVQEAPNYAKEASPTVMALAMKYKADLKRQNFRPADAQVDTGLSRGAPGVNFYDVIAGPG